MASPLWPVQLLWRDIGVGGSALMLMMSRSLCYGQEIRTDKQAAETNEFDI